MRGSFSILVSMLWGFVAAATVFATPDGKLFPLFVGNALVDLEWEPAALLDSDFGLYKVYRDDDHVGDISNRDTPFYRDGNGLLKGQTYLYRVDTIDDDGTLRKSEGLSVTTGQVRGEITVDTVWSQEHGSYDQVANVHVRPDAALTMDNVEVNGNSFSIQGFYIVAKACIFKQSAIHIGDSYGKPASCQIRGSKFDVGTLGYDIITVESGSGHVIESNNFANYGVAVHFENIAQSTISGNLFEGGNIGIWFEGSSGNSISNNEFASGPWAIRIDSESDGNNIEKNAIRTSQWGIALSDSSENEIRENSPIYGPVQGGVRIDRGRGNKVLENRLGEMGYGIVLTDTSDNLVLENELRDSGYGGGILVRSGASGNRIENNVVKGYREHGIEIQGSRDNRFEGNAIYQNAKCGFRIVEGSSQNTFQGNRVIRNGSKSIYLENSDGNTIFDNYFENCEECNVYDDGSNTWNTVPAQETNIVGGPWLGGNYWSDYFGRDDDHDGLGDTEVPYTEWGGIQNGGDMRPLVKRGNVVNIDTGEAFGTIGEAVEDADTLDGHTLEVGPGTYEENVALGKMLTVRGIGGPEITVVQAVVSGEPTVVVGKSGTFIEGVTVTGASGAVAGLLAEGSVGLKNCRIYGNQCHGLYTEEGKVQGQDLVISNNEGCGIMADSAANPPEPLVALENARIENNAQDGIYSDGDLFLAGSNNRIGNNGRDGIRTVGGNVNIEAAEVVGNARFGIEAEFATVFINWKDPGSPVCAQCSSRISDNGYGGIFVNGDSLENLNVGCMYGNYLEIKGNGGGIAEPAIEAGHGIYASNRVFLEEAVVSENHKHGIWVRMGNSDSEDASVRIRGTNNSVSRNGYSGITLRVLSDVTRQVAAKNHLKKNHIVANALRCLKRKRDVG